MHKLLSLKGFMFLRGPAPKGSLDAIENVFIKRSCVRMRARVYFIVDNDDDDDDGQ